MVKGISIGVASDTQAYEKGIKSGVIKPTEDAVKTLDKVAKAGEDGGEKLEGALREQQAETKKTGTAYQQLAKTVQTSEAAGTRAMALSGGQRTKIARQTVKQAGAAAASAATSSIGQLGSTVSSAVGGIGSTVAGISAGFGPAGLAIGAGVAAGLGLVTAGIQAQEKKLEELKSKYSDLYKSAAADGRAYLNEAEILAGVQNDLFEKDDAKRKQNADDAKALGVSLIAFLRAQNGDAEALNRIKERGNKLLDAQLKKENSVKGSRASQNNGYTETDLKLKGLLRTLDETKKVQDQNRNAAIQWAGSVGAVRDDAAKARAALAQIPKEKRVKLTADVSTAEKQIRDLGKNKTVKVLLSAHTRNGTRLF